METLKFKDKKVAVIGLGIEGSDAVNYLLSLGSKVTILDKNDEDLLDFSKIDKTKVDIICGDNYLNNLESFDYIVRSPGVYRFLPELVEAEKKGTVITSAIKIFFENCPGKIIGVTGTKGKGTTSTLIYEILKENGFDVYLSGNIGSPYLELLNNLKSDSWVVMEMSSFQLIDLEVSPNIAVVLNITSDHLNWHKDIEEYVESKRNIVKYQTQNDFAVVNTEYNVSSDFAKGIKSKVIGFSKKDLDPKFKQNLLLRGEHNLENIAAAVAVSRILNIDEDEVLSVVRSFKGLEHRLELVKTLNGISFYNDSFATGPQPTIAAINSFTETETLILGGSNKDLDYKELKEEINKKENVKNIILIGEIGNSIGEGIVGKNIINLGSSSMLEIVKKAYEITPKGGVVILSPAAASFDMFRNYKDRGNQFKKAVEELKNGQ